MKTGNAGYNLIIKYEGCRLTAYKPVPTEKFYTIGYGHYGADVKAGMTITKAEALKLLTNDIKKFENSVNNLGLTLTQNQFDALVSFAFNCGSANLNTLVRNRSLKEIADAMLKYNKAGGKVLRGLERRRKEERELFLKDYREITTTYDLEKIAREAAHDAIEMLHAEDMVGGDIPVVINNGFGGVILHEACVHGLEATSVAKGQSVFCGKLGQKIASDIVNAVDTGVDENEWGSINVDDEGTPSQRTVLIENGILKSYLVDKRNSRIMNHPVTGSSRRESYKNQTTSRMRNTYFLNGTSTFEEIIAATKYGLFAKSMGGGSVNPATGEFNFAVNVGYLIEDGKITKPVKGATLVGSGKDVLLRIDMIANNLSCSQGMCGSLSGSIPTNVGQPTIRVSNMTVGGKGGKN